MFSMISGRASSHADEADETVGQAIGRALEFLRQRQDASGAIHEGQYRTAMTALAGMAYLAAGHVPTDPTPEAETLRKALVYILDESRQDKNGYYGIDGSRMYGHGMVTLFLSEVIGMAESPEQERQIWSRLEKALALIARAQQVKSPSDRMHYGGWRYEPNSQDSDLSVTVWQLLSLRGAQNAALEVPAEVIEAAVGYVRRCFGGRAFGYQPQNEPRFTPAAYGLLSLQVCGEYEAPEVIRAAEWLSREEVHARHVNFYYGIYYYAQAMHQRGGELAREARRRVVGVLLPMQEADGGWSPRANSERRGGRVYATAMATLALSVRYHYLPIYQR